VGVPPFEETSSYLIKKGSDHQSGDEHQTTNQKHCLEDKNIAAEWHLIYLGALNCIRTIDILSIMVVKLHPMTFCGCSIPHAAPNSETLSCLLSQG